MTERYHRSDELDFSEEACIERYVEYPYFDDDCDDDNEPQDTHIKEHFLDYIRQHGYIAADLDLIVMGYTTRGLRIIRTVEKRNGLANL